MVNGKHPTTFRSTQQHAGAVGLLSRQILSLKSSEIFLPELFNLDESVH